MGKILITSPYSEFTDLIKQACIELEINNYVIIEGVMEEAAEAVRSVLDHDKDIELVISRGGTADAIKKMLAISVISEMPNEYDFLLAFQKAKVLGRTGIGLIAHQSFTDYEFEYLEEAIGIQVHKFFFENGQEIAGLIAQAEEAEIGTIIGGGSIASNLAARKKMFFVPMLISRRSLIDVLKRGKEILSIIQHDREKSSRLNTLIDHVNEGIMIISQNRTIEIINPIAAKLLKVKVNETVGRPIQVLDRNLVKTFDEGHPKIDHIIEIHRTKLVVNKIPLIVKHKTIGTVIIFQEVDKMQLREQTIRQKLSSKGLVSKFTFDDILTQNPVMLDTIEKAKRFGGTDTTVLIMGESGTGKELFAQSMHHISDRRDNPFVAVNCAALPESLLESELFGYEEGAFTGAKKGGKPGLFEMAHMGTIFLDEIGKVSLNLQGRLLRVLQEREVMRLGSDRVISVNIRVIAASNVDLLQEIESGNFRSDLYYRLNILNLELPPLRERKDDLPLLMKHFLNKFNRKFNKKVKDIPLEIIDYFHKHNWPGNVREFENYMERLVVLTDESLPNVRLLKPYASLVAPRKIEHNILEDNDSLIVQSGSMDEMMNSLIIQLYDRVKGNKSELAQILGISRTTLYKKLNELHC